MPQRAPVQGFKKSHRFQGTGTNYGLGVGTAFVSTGVHYEMVCVAGMQKISVRAKCTNTGTIDIFFLGPDVDIEALLRGNVAYASIAGTIYTSGGATQGTLVANTELQVTATPQGEDYAVVKLTGTATGAVTYIDVATLGVGFGG